MPSNGGDLVLNLYFDVASDRKDFQVNKLVSITMYGIDSSYDHHEYIYCVSIYEKERQRS